MIASEIQLIVGLGNPGPEYASTRHNAGVWFIDRLCEEARVTLSPEPKFKGHVGNFTFHQRTLRALVPTTYMNHSGQSVSAICHFFKIAPQHILVAHDDLDFPPGCARLKFDGSDGGHNGLKDLISHLGTKQFYRLRLGIGRPHREGVLDYVLHHPSVSDKKSILTGIDYALQVLPDLLDGNLSKAMTTLHTLAK